MNQCNSTEVQHPSCADDQSSIDSNAHFPREHMLKFFCPQQGSRSREELLENPSLKPLPKVQEETNNSQFVFPDLQCLVLGASRVGKTSLVQSLAGKRLLSEQANSQGIEDRLVDKESDTITKRPAFRQLGEFSPFYRDFIAELMLFNKDHRVTLSELVKLALEDYGLAFLLTIIFIVVIPIEKQLYSILGFSFGYLIMWSFLLFVLSRILCPTVSHLQRSWTDVLIILQRVDRSIGYHVYRTFSWMTVGAFLVLMANFYVRGISECQSDICLDIKSIWFPTSVLTVCVLVGLLSFCLLRTKRLYNNINGNRTHSRQRKAQFSKVQQAIKVVSIGRLIMAVFTGYFTFQTLMHTTMWEVSDTYTLTYDDVMVFAALLSVIWYVYLIMGSVIAIWPSTERFRQGRWVEKAAIVICFLLLFLFVMPSTPLVKICGLLYVAVFGTILYTDFTFLGMSAREEDIISNEDQQYLRLKILDFAGGREYGYSYRHLFFKHEALYLIVFNLAEFAEEDFRHVSLHIQRLQSQMKSLCTHVPCGTQILLIGTHRGNLDDNCIKVMDGHLKRLLYREYENVLVGNEAHSLHFFPVENSLGNKDTGIQALQRKIMSVAGQKRQGIGHDIPLSWILIRDAIVNLKAKSDAKFCVTASELQMAIFNDVFFQSLSFSNDMLKYFHEIGLTIYVDKKQDFDLSNRILLNPEKLVDIFTQVFALPIAQRTWLKDWDLLQSKGILTKALLQSLLSKVEEDEETIISFLEHYGLICPLENNKAGVKTRHDPELQPTHFVPSLLPLSADGDRPVWHNSEGDRKLYVFFCNFLPEALFHQLLSRAHKNSGIEFPNGKTVLYRNAGKFWMNPWLSYQLILMKEEEMIEVTYNSSHKSKKEPSDVLCHVFSMIDGICKSYFPLVKFHCGPACPSQTCPGHQDDYLTSLPTAEGNETRRRHVYNIMPGRQRNRTAYLYCENNCFEDELHEWIP
ncbi:PREDICTED: uncharacterized protein LOC107357772 isoform X2 [Acropora digitifera]|uniref:uncharacterized protein LOC107357772 isoform X2 n=1 Tax=Acropora digitifera TaxID=70779 RepID=UPI00077A7A1E|nr:PREDICTED: uncharacterized protein LOC107357772 isoform X2 [Acropora digitifera]